MYIYIYTNIYLFIFTQIYIYIYVSAKIYLTRHNLITYMFLFILPSFIQPPKKTNKGSTKFDLHAAAFRDLALPSYFVRAERHSYTVSVELPMVWGTQSWSILKSSFLYSSASFPYPDAACMEYSLSSTQFCSYFWANVSKYSIHGAPGICKITASKKLLFIISQPFRQPKQKPKPVRERSQNDPRIYRWIQSNKMELLPWQRVWWTIGHLLGFFDVFFLYG